MDLLYRTLFATLVVCLTLICTEHILRWFSIPLKALECFASLRLKDNSTLLRLFFAVEMLSLLAIRYLLGTLTWDLVRESFWVCLVCYVLINPYLAGPSGGDAVCDLVG